MPCARTARNSQSHPERAFLHQRLGSLPSTNACCRAVERVGPCSGAAAQPHHRPRRQRTMTAKLQHPPVRRAAAAVPRRRVAWLATTAHLLNSKAPEHPSLLTIIRPGSGAAIFMQTTFVLSTTWNCRYVGHFTVYRAPQVQGTPLIRRVVGIAPSKPLQCMQTWLFKESGAAGGRAAGGGQWVDRP